MIPSYRQITPSQSPPPTFALPSPVTGRVQHGKAAIGLGTATIGVVYIFNMDLRVDMQTMNDMIAKCCLSSYGTTDEMIGGNHYRTRHSTSSFIQFRRVPNETFGIALFRAAAPAARTALALSGVTLFGKHLYCQMDKRTQQLVEQWRFLRGKELSAKISSQGYDVPHNILELVNSELTEQVNKAKGLVVEQASLHELRLTRFQGLTEAEIMLKLEDDRIQQVLVRRAEEAVQLDKTSAELRVLSTQFREQSSKLSVLRKTVPVKSSSSSSVESSKRKLEHKSRSSGVSLFELRQMVPLDRDSLFRFPIDWDGIFSSKNHYHYSSVMQSFAPWVVRKVKDYLGSYDRELVEYILRKVKLRVDPLDFTTDLRQYLEDEAETLVKEIWSILAFETLRRKYA